MDSKSILEFERPIKEFEDQLQALLEKSKESSVDMSDEIASLKKKIERTKSEVYSNLTIWQKVQIARHPNRPYSMDYINRIFDSFQELHGDRTFDDDQSTVCGIANLKGKSFMLVAQQKGRTIKENLQRHFGSPNPEGYRKALRVMRLAEKFHMPIITFVDTPGAFPGIESEERHVAEAIAVNLREMSLLRTPIISVVIGEGGSGGALGIAVSDRVLILENAYYSVISPEGCAAILWKNSANAPEAANALRLSADKLVEFGVAEEVIKEPIGGAHKDYDLAASSVQATILKHLHQLTKLTHEELIKSRYNRFRKLGIFNEVAAS